jgi:hypothetical protein
MQFLASVGNAFLRFKADATPLLKCTISQLPFLTFYQTGCEFLRGIFIIPFVVFSNDFFSHSHQRKDSVL